MSWSTLQTDKKKTSRQMLKMGYTTSYMFPDTYQERHAFCQSLFSFQQCSKIYKTRKDHTIELKWNEEKPLFILDFFHKNSQILSIRFLFSRFEKKNCLYVFHNWCFISLFVCLFEQQMISRLIFKEKKNMRLEIF